MNLSTTGLVLASDAAIDLHLHTTCGDGIWTPQQPHELVAHRCVALDNPLRKKEKLWIKKINRKD